MRDYYHQTGVRKAIIDFVYSGSPEPLREGAFYSEEIDGIQRHSPDKDEGSVFVIDSERKFIRALRAGAKAFYASYWRYSDPSKPTGVRGRDLAWSLRAAEGGLSAAKRAAEIFLEALEAEGFPHPLVKYSGKLGFDILIPLEDVQSGSPDDLSFLSGVQENLTDSASSYIESSSSFQVEDDNSQIKLKGRSGTCLLTELRWRRGLLLAPMSLHPSSGLVSVPLSPREIPEFSVIEATPEKAHPREWPIDQAFPRDRTESIVRYTPGSAYLRA